MTVHEHDSVIYFRMWETICDFAINYTSKIREDIKNKAATALWYSC